LDQSQHQNNQLKLKEMDRVHVKVVKNIRSVV